MTVVDTFSPDKLNLFKRCPHRYYRRYVKHDLPLGRTTPALARGALTHNLLAIALRHRKRGRNLPFDLRTRVVSELHRGLYDGARDWQEDVERIVEWVTGAQAAIGDSGDILAVERELAYAVPGHARLAPFRVRARFDLILRHPDGAVEHLDWKTGGDYDDGALQTVLSRIVLAHHIPDRSRTFSTTMFLASGELQRAEMTRDEVNTGWSEISGLVAAIRTEQEWPAMPNFSCGSCPLYDHGCPLFARLNAATERTDGAAGLAT